MPYVYTFCTGSALADPVSVFKGSGFSKFSEKGTHDSGWGPSADKYQIQPLSSAGIIRGSRREGVRWKQDERERERESTSVTLMGGNKGS